MTHPLSWDTRFHVTEWSWLEVRLELRSLRLRSELYSVSFELDQPTQPPILCRIYGLEASRMVERNATREEQLEYYRDWFEMEREALIEELGRLPVLGKEIDLDHHVAFAIMDHYGMGSSEICRFHGGTVIWSEPPASAR